MQKYTYMSDYITRSIEPVLKKAVTQFSAVILTGPRQCGKTTLLKHCFSKTHAYVSLEPPDVRLSATLDPKGFLELHPSPVIFDEVQHVPVLLSYIKEKIDQKRSQKGQYILTGSQNLLLLDQVTESLAGRTAILKLLPFSLPEVMKDPFKPFFWDQKPSQQHYPFELKKFWHFLLRGCYPETQGKEHDDPYLWQSSYVQTYLERDIRNLKAIGDLTQFQLFLKALAVRSGQLLHISDLAKEIGLSVNTVKSWISILEATYQILILRPYFSSHSKRLVKMPKVYFTDVGLLSYFLGIKTVDQLMGSPFLGLLFETFVVSEIYKRFLYQGEEPVIYFWRTATGIEIDLLVQVQGQMLPIEIKSSSTPNLKMIHHLNNYLVMPKTFSNGLLIYVGDTVTKLGEHIFGVPIVAL